MENVILTVHLILALLLIGAVLLQRSEGGGLGMGGGGGGVMTGRQAANALSKATWIIAVGFLITSTTLTLLAARQSSITSVIDQLGLSTEAPAEAPTTGLPGLPDYTPPPGSPILPGAGQPLTPPVPAAPAAAPEAAAPTTDAPAAAPEAAAPATEAPAADSAAPEAAAPATEAPAADVAPEAGSTTPAPSPTPAPSN